MVLGIFHFQKYKGNGNGDEQNVMSCLGPDRPGQNAILSHSLPSKTKKKEEHLAPPICNDCPYNRSKSKAKYEHISNYRVHPLASNP